MKTLFLWYNHIWYEYWNTGHPGIGDEGFNMPVKMKNSRFCNKTNFNLSVLSTDLFLISVLSNSIRANTCTHIHTHHTQREARESQLVATGSKPQSYPIRTTSPL